ncbi:RPA-interacting protein, C-terminal domain [Phytophthora cinnamomi]|uniref:RPA-interacting protein, C-terminal domain n=1 Tax=Phytophthora cinnamomi TaxID=4785 RepID=UPI00355AC7F3|nr:RPA-interacting protein, C-terminal domain [Phytophthora cinnamomi]
MMPPHRSPLKRLSLSPPAWKDQLRQRCLQRLKRDRGQLLAKLRRADALSVSEEMQRLVAREQQQQQTALSVDDLLLLGRLKESDYLDIVHSLEDALRHETGDDEEEEELRMAEHMAGLEDAELEAMLAGMDLGEPQQDQLQHVASDAGFDGAELELQQEQDCSISVLCPICKAGYLREHSDDRAAEPFISCGCGFTFHVQYVYHSVLEDFQDKIVNAFMAHRDLCYSDPTFEKQASLDDGTDVLCIKCAHCGCNHILP